MCVGHAYLVGHRGGDRQAENKGVPSDFLVVSVSRRAWPAANCPIYFSGVLTLRNTSGSTSFRVGLTAKMGRNRADALTEDFTRRIREESRQLT